MITEIKQYFEKRKIVSDLDTSCLRFGFEMFGDSLPRANAMLRIFYQRLEAAEKFNGYAKIKPIDVETYKNAYYRCEFEIEELEYRGYFSRNTPQQVTSAVQAQSIDALVE
jgi:hypothetical protein